MNDDGMRFHGMATPAGDFYLMGDDVSLKNAMFGTNALRKKIASHVPEGITVVIGEAIEFIEGYFSGRQSQAPELDLGIYTEKERAIYRALQKVPFGRTIGYEELAGRAGIPRGGRFAGNSMAKNRFPLFIPCHRVIRADGGIGNYSGGSKIKEFLLRHEGAL